jgi:hypothetical protein
MREKPTAPDVVQRPEHLFVVRMWQESSRRAPDQWRGSVEHVPSGQRLYFVSLGDLNAFITTRISRHPLSGTQEGEGC